jgi:hypothetical protein
MQFLPTTDGKKALIWVVDGQDQVDFRKKIEDGLVM